MLAALTQDNGTLKSIASTTWRLLLRGVLPWATCKRRTSCRNDRHVVPLVHIAARSVMCPIQAQMKGGAQALTPLGGATSRYGYHRLQVLLQRGMGAIIRKRMHRFPRLEGLNVRRQK